MDTALELVDRPVHLPYGYVVHYDGYLQLCLPLEELDITEHDFNGVCKCLYRDVQALFISSCIKDWTSISMREVLQVTSIFTDYNLQFSQSALL